MYFSDWISVKSEFDAVIEIDSLCFPNSHWNILDWKRLFQHQNLILHYHLENGQLVAFSLVSLVGEEAELLKIGVHPNFRQNGIARRLLAEQLKFLIDNQIEVLFLEVRATNKNALKLYISLGFRNIGVRKGYYKDPECDALLFQLNLSKL